MTHKVIDYIKNKSVLSEHFVKINSVKFGKKEVLPIIEGGKGISASNGKSSGAFAFEGAIGTFSGVNADLIDSNGEYVPLVYHGRTRQERHNELIEYSIKSGISQAKIAKNVAGNNGLININILWEMAASRRVLHGIMEKTNGLIDGITCGAGMPYKLSEIAAQYNVLYYPIISSARAFNALWKRSYNKFPELIGGVVYEDPWLAGGHNGISNSDDPLQPESPDDKLLSIRKTMNQYGLNAVPVIFAGGVWSLGDFTHLIENKDLQPLAFQFGTRPLLTVESPIPESWKRRLLTIKKGDVLLQRFSPTGFYSSAVNNNFLKELQERSSRQVYFSKEKTKDLSYEFNIRNSVVYIVESDMKNISTWKENGFTEILKTPDSTLIFLSKDQKKKIVKDQTDCTGCLSYCRFSNWQDTEPYATGKVPDPRSFCIQKTLQNIVHFGDVENELLFAGHNAYRFSQDSFYENGFIPTVKQLIDRISDFK